ncbi:hypothetical protein GCM10022286_01790 [Gryllotalpicola daejeonensis]|uniref:N-acetyltransferase domain-containing protein n=1 Tax=Gryllotalpicola daejeonensis TaxID=993087 RepID=A0ABP7ZDG8_9MICO
MNVHLRPWRAEDAPALLTAQHSNSDLDSQFGDAEVANEAQAVEYIQSTLRFGDAFKNWAIVVDDLAVGNVGLAHIERRHDTAWAHYWLGAGARGHGYASRALAAVAGWAFSDGLYRLELGHRVNNPSSCRVATAAGFVAEGLERQKLRYGTERFDVETHARLATDPVPMISGMTVAS